ncbi:MAG: DUF11 domain-containing protein [Lachnospiraceae bacterium]|nr:DUF11 domain-containing protein [Lachnospiraceae bacterium]
MAVAYINNQVSVSYEYEAGAKEEGQGSRHIEFSNVEVLHIREKPNPRVKVRKIASRKEVAPEDTITYKITFLNAGNVSVTKFYVQE